MAVTFDRSSMLRQVRHRLGPKLNRLLRTLGQPTTRVYPEGYIGSVDRPIDEVEAELRAGGFSWDPLSIYHFTPEGNDTDGSWVYRDSLFADRQIHVVLIDRTSATELYAHEEYNWARHPAKHAKELDIRRDRGSAQVKRWLDERGLKYDVESTPVQKGKHYLQRVSGSLVKSIFG